jgi:hypothetical protein
MGKKEDENQKAKGKRQKAKVSRQPDNSIEQKTDGSQQQSIGNPQKRAQADNQCLPFAFCLLPFDFQRGARTGDGLDH